jgi:pimeloyl-ACP methyl ester carboxylesterase
LFGDAEKVHLVGHSFGGLVAGVAAIQDPSRWASLTMLCSGPGGLSDGSIYEDALLVADSVERDGLESVYRARRLRDLQRGRPPLPDALEARYRHRFLASSAHSLTAMARHLTGAPDRTADLVALDLTIAVVRGKDDTWPHESQDALAAALDTHVEIIDGAAHAPAVEQPEATRDALARIFLR